MWKSASIDYATEMYRNGDKEQEREKNVINQLKLQTASISYLKIETKIINVQKLKTSAMDFQFFFHFFEYLF